MSYLQQHLNTGGTHICRAWAVTRRDGVEMGFTDHDRDLSFEGITFRAGSGLTALAVQQTTGLAVDNTETLGALSASAIRAEDISAGLYDGAEIRAWDVRWDDVSARALRFRGSIGQIRKQGAAFSAELRGLTEALNQPGGRVFHGLCPAVLGDSACGVDLDARFTGEATVVALDASLRLEGLSNFAEGWFAQGRLEVLTGAATGQSGMIGSDRGNVERHIALTSPLGADLAPGDRVRLIAGCDKRFETCREKFGNMLNFRGFPHIPGEDWLMSVPQRDGQNDGGSLFS